MSVWERIWSIYDDFDQFMTCGQYYPLGACHNPYMTNDHNQLVHYNGHTAHLSDIVWTRGTSRFLVLH